MPELLPIEKLQEISKYRDRRSIAKWLGRGGIVLLKVGKNYCVIKDVFDEIVMNPLEIYSRKKTQNFENTNNTEVNYTIGEQVLAKPFWMCMMPQMEKDEIIQIPAHLKSPGFYIKCRHCNTWVSKNKCRETEKHISQCPHQDKLQYISVIQVPNSSRRDILTLDTRNVNKAFEMYAQHRRSVKEGNTVEKEIQQVNIKNTETEKTFFSIEELIQKYIAHLDGADMPEHKKKKSLSKRHLADIKRVVEKYFPECLKQNGIDAGKQSIDAVNDDVAVAFHRQLEGREVSARSYNKYMGVMQTFFSFLTKNKYGRNNPFAGFSKKDARGKDPVIITEEQLEKLLKEFRNKDSEYGKQVYPSGSKNLYREFLPDAVLYSLFSGRRLTECFFSKWNQIQVENGIPVRIEVVDRKGTNLKRSANASPKIVYVPVSRDLMNFLNSKGYREKIGMDEYIIAPHEKGARENLALYTSRAFSHYSQKLFGENHPTFHSLRRTYATQLSREIGPDKARIILGWKSANILQDHYISPKAMSTLAKDFSVFGENRENEIQEIRNKKQLQQQNTLER